MNHHTTRRFRELYVALPQEVRQLADRKFALLKDDPSHPSLHFKKVGKFWSVRISRSHRALALPDGSDFIWVWIGLHDEYDRLIQEG